MLTTEDILKTSHDLFSKNALEVFQYQYAHNLIYKKYVDLLKVNPAGVNHITSIPCLPVELFKSERIITGDETYQTMFTSSGTTGSEVSRHYVKDTALYNTISEKGFELFYGEIHTYTFLALLPSYLERTGSSLIHMVQHFMNISQQPGNGFYLDNFEALYNALLECDTKAQPTILIGVSFALLDFAEYVKTKNMPPLQHTRIMETGGMKGRRKEITREELYHTLKDAFKIETIDSEYGMTELLSQAYSTGYGYFKTPPWMQVLIRDINDPFCYLDTGRTGGINVIDLANVHSCSFIQLSDLGRLNADTTFEVLGRFDNSDLRGCNLLVG